ncbi:MAG: hypothetical protein GY710_25070 [Desulfobacteraceae bacterium]|nr:hypothetical protein [Desulfobacteraceae bacterium]
MLDIHVGFMDEESKPILEQMMRMASSTNPGMAKEKYLTHMKIESSAFEAALHRIFLLNANRPIYVVERGNQLEQESLFEMIDNQYSVMWDFKAVAVIPEHGQKSVLPTVRARRGTPKACIGRRFTSGLAFRLGQVAEDNDLAWKITTLWNSKQKTKVAFKPKMCYTVLGINCAQDKNIDHRNPLIIVRAPEMGFQPDLIRLHLKTIFLALGKMKYETALQVKRTGMNIYMYGAGGAVGKGTKPGALRQIMSTFYIGAELHEPSVFGAQPAAASGEIKRKRLTEDLEQRWCGVVAYATPDVHTIIYKSDPLEDETEAIKLAKQKFKGDELKIPIKGCMALSKALYPSYSVSLTSSQFMGGDIKHAARSHGLTGDCAMEDYHVLRLIHEIKYSDGGEHFPTLFNSALARIDCDPPHIDKKVFNAFKLWAEEARWTKNHYKQAILWGLRGLQLDKIDWETANWSFARYVGESVGAHQKDSYLFVYKDKEEEFVLCPFYCEVACDFLPTIVEKGKEVSFGANMQVATFAKLQREAKDIRTSAASLLKSNVEALEEKIDTFLDTFEAVIKANGLWKDEAPHWPIWARPGWQTKELWNNPGCYPFVSVKAEGQNQKKAIADIWDEHFPDSSPNGNVDRALYKSTNMVCLQLLGIEGMSKLVHEHRWGNVMNELKTSQKAKSIREKAGERDWKKFDDDIDNRPLGSGFRLAIAKSRFASFMRMQKERDRMMAGLTQLVREMYERGRCAPTQSDSFIPRWTK